MKLKSVLMAAGAGLAAIAVARRAALESLLGQVVVITGGSRGLGLALAEEFASHGARLVLAARDAEELEEARQHLAQRNDVGISTIACDLTREEDADRLIREASAIYGRVDILVNNAGVIIVGPIEMQTRELFHEAMAANFFTMLNATYAVLPQMLARRKGRIVNICSIGGKIPVPHLAPYVASKFAAAGFSETLHAELRPKGIRVTTVNPGLLRTGSYPNAIVVGRKKEEYRWFRLSASAPGLAHSAAAAARKIVSATARRATEIEIGCDAYLAARIHGLLPGLVQSVGSLAEMYILPEAGGSGRPEQGSRLHVPLSAIWKRWSDVLTSRYHQPPA